MIGLDIVEIARFANEKHGASFMRRVFTDEERNYVKNSPHPTETMAGLFAAKEAISKALGTGIGKIPFTAMEITHDTNGAPTVRLHGRAKEQLRSCFAERAEIAITHDGGVAVAVCVVLPSPAVALQTTGGFSAHALSLLQEKGGQHRELAASLLRRDRTGYKTQYGKVAIVGGSRGMVGAVCLAAQAALRCGAGLVYAVVPESISSAVQNKLLEGIVRAVPDDGRGHFTLAHLPEVIHAVSDCSAVAIGPGLSHFDEAASFVADLADRLLVPCVLDADGINALASCPERLKETAKQFAADFHSFVVLKGAETVVTDGKHTTLNPSGTAGMATAGSGDVLTGMLVAFLGAGYPTRTAARLACDLHGLAGEFAEEALGEECMIASDLLRYIPTAFRLFHVLREQEEKGEMDAEDNQG